MTDKFFVRKQHANLNIYYLFQSNWVYIDFRKKWRRLIYLFTIFRFCYKLLGVIDLQISLLKW